jgi:tRNA(fMet)-specific endonuclease VapC
MTLMLDTNAYTAYMRDDPPVAERVEASTRILLPAVAVGELIYGFRYGTRYQENLGQLERFLTKPFVEFVPVIMETCSRFGLISAALRQAGTPIPVNDIWIAAHALQTGAPLLTHDAHFDYVAGLAVVHPE